MELVTSVAALTATLQAERAAGRTIGLVPTMGALHRGHAALVRRAAADTDTVVVSVFVNPLQFGAGEDFDAYPRTLDADCAVADQAGASIVFAPSRAEMYHGPVLTTVSVARITASLEGGSRPGHFDGVTTVVAKLFSIVGACRAYFGEKDFQQLAVVRRMAADLSMPVEVIGCETVREPDGLALSSRNAYLHADDRRAATVLHRSLCAGAALVARGVTDPTAVRAAIAGVVAEEPRADLDYVAVVDPRSFETPARLVGDVRLLVAARVGPARLIDNVGVTVPADPVSCPAPARKEAQPCAGA